MEPLRQLIHSVLHLDESLNSLAATLGPWLYGLLFLIVFAETGLVVTPFLPGDSLLFAVGALAAAPGSVLSLPWISVLLVVAAILGDAVNYAVGYWLGPKVFNRPDSKLLNTEHLRHAQRFYDKYGGKTIILARFIPIVRTFAPFVAGIGKMNYFRFALYNVTGGLVWVLGFLFLGYAFGTRPYVQKNFHVVIFAIIGISILPALWEFWRARQAAKRGDSPLLEVSTIGEDPHDA